MQRVARWPSCSAHLWRANHCSLEAPPSAVASRGRGLINWRVVCRLFVVLQLSLMSGPVAIQRRPARSEDHATFRRGRVSMASCIRSPQHVRGRTASLVVSFGTLEVEVEWKGFSRSRGSPGGQKPAARGLWAVSPAIGGAFPTRHGLKRWAARKTISTKFLALGAERLRVDEQWHTDR